MARTTARATRPQRRFRRWIILGILGIVLGLGAVTFFAKIHNPFGTSLGNPLVLVPGDVDYVLAVPDFPGFLTGLQERRFVTTLGENRNFQDFLDTPDIRRTGVVDAVRSALRELDAIQGNIPLGLDLLGDVSGTEVIVAGYAPEDLNAKWPFMCIFRPESWLALAGANILLNETLCSLVMKGPLSKMRVGIEHTRDTVQLTMPNDVVLHIARIADAIVVSTEGDQLNMIHNAVSTQGIPPEPDIRFEKVASDLDARQTEIQILMKRAQADRMLDLSQRLDTLWGPEMVELVESSMPRMGGEDMFLRMDIDEGMTLELRVPTIPSSPDDVFSIINLTSKTSLKEFVSKGCSFVPQSSFGLIYAGASCGDLLGKLVQREAFVTAEDRKLLDDSLRDVPGLGSLDGLVSTTRRLTSNELGLVFFKQPRAPIMDAAGPGFLLVSPLADETEARRVIESLRSHVRQTAGEGAIKEMTRREQDGVLLYEILLTSGVADDDRLTKPGLAIVMGHLVMTNYYDYLKRFAATLQSEEGSLGDNLGIAEAAGHSPDTLNLSGLMDFGQLWEYMLQSIDGWAYDLTSPGPVEEQNKRVALEIEAAEQYVRGTPDFQNLVQREFVRWRTGLEKVDRPAIRQRFQRYLHDLKGIFTSLGVFIQAGLAEASLTIRLDVRR